MSAQHECVIITKNLHKIKYHKVSTWNEVVNLFYPVNFIVVLDNVFRTGVLCTISAHDKRKRATSCS